MTTNRRSQSVPRAASCLTLLALTLALAATHIHAGTVRYRIADLGTLGGEMSEAAAINELGQVVGWSVTTDGNVRAFRTAPNNRIDPGTDALPTATAAGETRAFGINEAGQVVGITTPDGTPSDGASRAFLYESGSMRDLGAPVVQGSLLGINNAGQVVGSFQTGNPGPFGQPISYAFRTSPGSGIDPARDNLGTLGGASSGATAINDAGQVVGWSHSGTDGQHAFLYEDGVMRDLGALAGGTSTAWDINAAGQVVGEAGTGEFSESGFAFTHAFLYEGGSMRDLAGTQSGADYSAARAINDSGQVVGAGPVGAVLFEDGVMHYLADLIPEDSGWDLGVAMDINNRGQIVGGGYNSDGEYHAYLLTPVDDGGPGPGPNPNPIPLPPGVWAGLVVLVAIVARQAARRKQAGL